MKNILTKKASSFCPYVAYLHYNPIFLTILFSPYKRAGPTSEVKESCFFVTKTPSLFSFSFLMGQITNTKMEEEILDFFRRVCSRISEILMKATQKLATPSHPLNLLYFGGHLTCPTESEDLLLRGEGTKMWHSDK